MRALVLVSLIACGGAPVAKPKAKPNPDVATVPLHVEGNRPFIDLTFTKADGRAVPRRQPS